MRGSDPFRNAPNLAQSVVFTKVLLPCLRYRVCMTYVLHYAPDNASMIVRLALEEIGVAYECVLVDRRTAQQTSPEYLALNPNGLIPVLETDEGPLFETGAILLWLADRHKTLAPAPADPGRGAFLTWLFFVSNTLHPALRQLFYPWKVMGDATDKQDDLSAGLKALLQDHFRTLDQNWPAPDAPDVTSLYIAACLRWSAIYGHADRSWFDLDAYPRLADMAAKLETRDSVARVATAEGLGDAPFSRPTPANPPIGSAL